MVHVEIENLGEFIVNKTHEFCVINLPSTLKNFLDENIVVAEREMQIGYGRSGLTIKTGKLIDSLQIFNSQTYGGAEMKIEYGASYASYMEFGTSPHTIFGNPVLRWTDGGVDHFAKSVSHPGTRPYKFLENPTKSLNDTLLQRLPYYLQKMWK